MRIGWFKVGCPWSEASILSSTSFSRYTTFSKSVPKRIPGLKLRFEITNLSRLLQVTVRSLKRSNWLKESDSFRPKPQWLLDLTPKSRLKSLALEKKWQLPTRTERRTDFPKVILDDKHLKLSSSKWIDASSWREPWFLAGGGEKGLIHEGSLLVKNIDSSLAHLLIRDRPNEMKLLFVELSVSSIASNVAEDSSKIWKHSFNFFWDWQQNSNETIFRLFLEYFEATFKGDIEADFIGCRSTSRIWMETTLQMLGSASSSFFQPLETLKPWNLVLASVFFKIRLKTSLGKKEGSNLFPIEIFKALTVAASDKANLESVKELVAVSQWAWPRWNALAAIAWWTLPSKR